MSGMACSSLLVSLLLSASADAPPSPVGKRVELAALADCLGADAVAGWKQSRANVIVFVGTECPLAARYAPRLAELAEKYRGQGVRFFGVDSNQRDSLAAIAHFAQLHRIAFPVCKDPGNKVADRLGAVRTPEAFVLDGAGVVRYWGLIDDQFGVGYAHDKAKRPYVEESLGDILAGREVRVPLTRSVGCRIGRVNRRAPHGDVTYANQISRIFRANCVECHRAGEVAPFALTSYADAAAWAETIREVIDEGRMPPWRANPAHGKFRNDARLSEADKHLVRDWIDNGLPEGDASQLPPKAAFPEGWRIPKPDLVIKMPEPFTVPASGVVEYKYFTVDPGFTHDVWIRAAEARPGNRGIVHHMLLFYVPPEQATARPEDALFNAVAAFAPGLPPSIGPVGYAGRIPAGSRLVFQMHYTPNGSEQVDQSEAGLILADPAQVKREITVGGIFNWQFLIPPRAPDYRVEAEELVKEDRVIYDMVPHMHLRGKSFRFTAVYPDGRNEVLLDVPRYDFNWQNVYRLAQPKTLPAGTRIDCLAAFDNSESNLLNPDPASEVHWGDQTWDEMMVGSYDFSPADQDFSLGPPRATRRADGRYDVAFRYRPATHAQSVYLAGNFNDWKPTALPMSGPDKDGFFTATVPLAIGRYQYKYVVEGKLWKTDPGNMFQTGSYHNSVVVVGPLHPPVVTRRNDGKYTAAFRYHPANSCKTVSLVGSFNGWKPAGQDLQGPDAEGWYATSVELAEGRHEYQFVVDGKTWTSDPGNPVESGKKHSSVLWARP
jgi:thiol-disulfide isomerase/thioredoxin/mono/diheme cytochrome c family protein